ncbi:Polyketide biosynthesis malonyl CoA-acyl carrier protein transacylase PksC (plasmid) [Streptomyces sp. YIM 121038]|uniref:ACP S-malonyltransferase n=1 Tax=Streptomyces sp. YIM 121038 TaxID=2136401 RepID=UPI00111089CA|nr:ACP S-malonyltransferase [Streptomyces sp. YIM 121038]QCX82549.1 Polyketide biosynthesis malonyl CoA-acyl carrier protein transacylase PksC [Streptomyces sp. YIM 121038]
MRTVYCFPGQGVQRVGMCADLFDRFPEIAAVASEVLGYSIRTLCVQGPPEKLADTRFTQPAVYVANALAWRSRRRDRVPAGALGHSLGEYNALEAAGVFNFVTGLCLVRDRAAATATCTDGGMLAVVGPTTEQLQTLLQQASLNGVDIANLNSRRHQVLAGPEAELSAAARVLTAAGAKVVTRLAINGPFHSRYMRAAAQEFQDVLDGLTFAEPAFPVWSNCTARPHRAADTARLLVSHLTQAVRWQECVTAVLDEGAAEFVEVGESTVLTSMIRHIRADREEEKS